MPFSVLDILAFGFASANFSGRTPKIFAAGYSMGGIILANYCGQYSQNPLLKGAIHFSGLHDAVPGLIHVFLVIDVGGCFSLKCWLLGMLVWRMSRILQFAWHPLTSGLQHELQVFRRHLAGTQNDVKQRAI